MLEDLHWADDSTLLLTEYLAPLLPEMPVRIIGTYRDDEVDTSHPLSRVINQLSRRRLIDRTGLRRLSFGGVRAMVEALAGQPPPEELVRVIDSETEGNPFFVEELYLHLAESGVLLDERGRVRADLKVDEASVPESIRLVVGERLSRLSPRPARRWSRRRFPAGYSPLISSVRWPLSTPTPSSTPSRRPKEHGSSRRSRAMGSRLQPRADPAELVGRSVHAQTRAITPSSRRRDRAALRRRP